MKPRFTISISFLVSFKQTPRNSLKCSFASARRNMSSQATSPLFQPLKVGPITLKNRIVMSALTRSRSVPTNVPNDLNVEHYRQRAKGGAGLIVTEAVLVTQQGTEWPHAPGLWSAEHVEGWKKVTNAVHEEGGLIYAQVRVVLI
jgi:2,4-dienoyl-CoA reductase-like NADH-dependent reductase (Old Yellow Enzyme family)